MYLIPLLLLLLISPPTYAVCPVCTVAVGAGLGIFRALGIDDMISGLWVGGLIMSMSFWMSDWLAKKFPKFKYGLLTSYISMFVLTIVPLNIAKIIGHPDNKIWGIDKIMFGTIFGMIAFITGYVIDQRIRQKNNGKVLMYYQKVILPVSALLISSGIMYAVVKLIYHG